MIEAKKLFSRILELHNSEESNSNNSDVLNDKLRSARKFILERNYEDAVEDYLYIIEKNVNWKNGISKDELLSLFSFLGNSNAITTNGRGRLLNMLYK